MKISNLVLAIYKGTVVNELSLEMTCFLNTAVKKNKRFIRVSASLKEKLCRSF